ncbi:MAG: ribbon-helix-helix protein, CopG family [Myxococcota bacterium]
MSFPSESGSETVAPARARLQYTCGHSGTEMCANLRPACAAGPWCSISSIDEPTIRSVDQLARASRRRKGARRRSRSAIVREALHEYLARHAKTEREAVEWEIWKANLDLVNRRERWGPRSWKRSTMLLAWLSICPEKALPPPPRASTTTAGMRMCANRKRQSAWFRSSRKLMMRVV